MIEQFFTHFLVPGAAGYLGYHIAQALRVRSLKRKLRAAALEMARARDAAMRIQEEDRRRGGPQARTFDEAMAEIRRILAEDDKQK